MVERRVHWPVAWTPGNTDFYCVYLALKTLFGPYSELYVNNRNIPQFGRWRNSVVCRKVKNIHQHVLFYAFTMSSQKLLRLVKKEYMTTALGYLSDSVPIADDIKWEKSVMIHGCEQYSLYVHQSFPSPKFSFPDFETETTIISCSSPRPRLVQVFGSEKPTI